MPANCRRHLFTNARTNIHKKVMAAIKKITAKPKFNFKLKNQ